MNLKAFLVPVVTLFLLNGCEPSEAPASQSDNTFQTILTDSTLNQWSGKEGYWTFENGVLTGETTPNTILIENTFFIWDGDTGHDFELKADFRISERGNSGINYYSKPVKAKEFMLSGYQADLDGSHNYTGNVYEERGRATLANRGEIVNISEGNFSEVLAKTGTQESLFSKIDTTENGWNKYHIIARGNSIIHLVNGQIMTILLNDDGAKSTTNKLGFQLHLGPPMKVEFRNIRLKKL
ncbi:3-keto-disaccharide hydrolase [Gracilimonas sp. BCB1]|uniref:3-keto-disaccharide hydrolase n=1 Tax=Gracilimonas sp. BCB1 TaxID=3152362 RepID=UPI0032D9AAC1